ncbi:MAG: hypothetical protein AAF664_23040, partial [Planctomycetota bacterium]
ERVADHVAIIASGKLAMKAPMDSLRSDYQHVVANVDDPTRAISPLPCSAGVLDEQSDGRQRIWIVRGFKKEDQSWLASQPGVESIQTRGATLEEIFVAVTSNPPSNDPSPAELKIMGVAS